MEKTKRCFLYLDYGNEFPYDFELKMSEFGRPLRITDEDEAEILIYSWGTDEEIRQAVNLTVQTIECLWPDLEFKVRLIL